MQQNYRTDEEIAVKVQQEDVELFGVLVERYEKRMLRYARKFLFNHEDAKDVVQDVFIKAYTNIQSFDAKKKFSPWIYRIAHNTFINALKRSKKEAIPFFTFDTLFPHIAAKETADRETLDSEIRIMLDKCLDDVDPKYREPLILYYLEEFDYKEIVDIMHIPLATVGVRLKRGRERLRTSCIKHNYHI